MGQLTLEFQLVADGLHFGILGGISASWVWGYGLGF